MNAIKGQGGKVLGYIKDTSTGQTLLATGGRVLGYFNESANSTTDGGGRFIGYGNQLMILLED
jgi:hypothetical protein